jgi:hypothetical protein
VEQEAPVETVASHSDLQEVKTIYSEHSHQVWEEELAKEQEARVAWEDFPVSNSCRLGSQELKQGVFLLDPKWAVKEEVEIEDEILVYSLK